MLSINRHVHVVLITAKTAMMHNYVFLPVFDRMSIKSQASCQSAICSIGRRQNILLNATGLLMLLFTLEGVKVGKMRLCANSDAANRISLFLNKIK